MAGQRRQQDPARHNAVDPPASPVIYRSRENKRNVVANRERSRVSSTSQRIDTRDDPEFVVCERKSYLDDTSSEETASDGLDDSERVQTAHGYLSPDSAEGFVREQSTGSRYDSQNSSHSRKKFFRRRHKERSSSTTNERRDGDDTRMYYDECHSTELQHNNGVIKNDRRNGRHESQDGMIVPKKSETKKSRHEQSDVSNLKSRQPIDGAKNRREFSVLDRRKQPPHKKKVIPQRPQRTLRRPAHIYEEDNRQIVDRVSSLEFDEIEVENADSDPYYDDDGRDIATGSYREQQGSYYATKSGLVSDVEFVETDRTLADVKQATKGLFRKIRHSVRGSSTLNKKGDRHSQVATRQTIEETRNSRNATARKPLPMFERIPPSFASEDSDERQVYERNHLPVDYVQDDYVDRKWHDRHHPQHRPERPSNQVHTKPGLIIHAAQEMQSENKYTIDEYEQDRVRRQSQYNPIAYSNEDYWEEQPGDLAVASSSAEDDYALYTRKGRSLSQVNLPQQPQPSQFLDYEPEPVTHTDYDRHRRHHHVPVIPQTMTDHRRSTRVPVGGGAGGRAGVVSAVNPHHRRHHLQTPLNMTRQHPTCAHVGGGDLEDPSDVAYAKQLSYDNHYVQQQLQQQQQQQQQMLLLEEGRQHQLLLQQPYSPTFHQKASSPVEIPHRKPDENSGERKGFSLFRCS
jgi:hypothetical protein